MAWRLAARPLWIEGLGANLVMREVEATVWADEGVQLNLSAAV